MAEVRGAMEVAGRSIVVASHPRSGTHLVIDLLRRQFPQCAPPRTRLLLGREPYWNLDELLSVAGRQGVREIARMADVGRAVLKTHRRPDFFAPCQFTNPVLPEHAAFVRSIMARAAKIYVYRSVADTMKSLYAFVCPKREVPFATFIREIRGPWDRVGWWAMHVGEWSEAQRTLLVSYDTLLRDPEATLLRIAAFVGETPLMRTPILPRAPSSANAQRLKRILALHRESTAFMSYGSRRDEIRPTEDDLAFMRGETEGMDAGLLTAGREDLQGHARVA